MTQAQQRVRLALNATLARAEIRAACSCCVRQRVPDAIGGTSQDRPDSSFGARAQPRSQKGAQFGALSLFEVSQTGTRTFPVLRWRVPSFFLNPNEVLTRPSCFPVIDIILYDCTLSDIYSTREYSSQAYFVFARIPMFCFCLEKERTSLLADRAY